MLFPKCWPRPCSAMDDADFILTMNGWMAEICSAKIKSESSIAKSGRSGWGQHASRVVKLKTMNTSIRIYVHTYPPSFCLVRVTYLQRSSQVAAYIRGILDQLKYFVHEEASFEK